ncbi:MAG TPA: hypothetical protein PLX88_10745 [Syntrophorhabdaceae bacterium]|jgi:DNA-directed RNA polymerase subunit RPC12/RpoP|nr:hypothetical protein [Syntrophorhabdaceae bacterium]MDI9560702.1 hypothetical protein [Pseudomonadota bacterium]MBV6505497.1 hypothetical protein [Syntrophorhabdaceae bacterium]HNZ59330.1 hypothetical protein [Syntrophorhabdaceae bacterium]HOB70086.1 hypothetical protein [Syntrophorhabdaceae bacterium]
MPKVNLKRYVLYLVRWQLSTPILAGVLFVLSSMDKLTATVIANLIGGLIFFWVDIFIFTSRRFDVEWEIQEDIICVDCGKISRGYRIVKAANYDKSTDKKPQFRCEECSIRKTEELRKRGISV